MLDLNLVRKLIANINESELPTNPDFDTWSVKQQAEAGVIIDCRIWLKWEASPTKTRDKLINKISKYFDSKGNWNYQG